MARITQLLVATVDFVRVMTVCTIPSMHLEMIASPALCRVNRARASFDRILVKADDSSFFEWTRWMGMNDRGRGSSQRWHGEDLEDSGSSQALAFRQANTGERESSSISDLP
jgi:hypothetical protein